MSERCGVVVALMAAACVPGEISSREQALLEGLVLTVQTEVPPAVDNPVADDAAAIDLGHHLYFDEGFALDAEGLPQALSCNDCHNLACGGADTRSDGPTSLGAGWTSRNSPTVFNGVYRTSWAWDGSRVAMWHQNQVPVLSGAVMNATERSFAEHVVETWSPEYAAGFGGVPTQPLSDDDVQAVFDNGARALEAYLRQMTSMGSPFDRWVADGDASKMTPEAIHGAQLFVGRAACNECHYGPTLSDEGFHNIGIPQTRDDLGRAGVDCNDDGVHDYQQADLPDGVCDSRGGPSDPEAGAFHTPPLRDVALTGPYMHDGSLQTLWDVVDHYRFGGQPDGYPGQLDPKIQELGLSDADVNDLVAFLETLTGGPLPKRARSLLCPPDDPGCECVD
jgi:cytochrome c peroxidase